MYYALHSCTFHHPLVGSSFNTPSPLCYLLSTAFFHTLCKQATEEEDLSMATAAAVAVAVACMRRRVASTKETALKRMEASIEQASLSIHNGDIHNPTVYSQTCIKLGRLKTELLQPSLMLLLLPIKAACKIGWFPDGDKDCLLIIAKEVSYGFCSTDKMNIEPSNAHSSVSNIVSRFYPMMKVEHLLTSFDVKAGYGTFAVDFHISLGATPRHCRNLWLLVAQLDNMETAACITNPLKVDFLINGCEVPNRTRNNMGNGPQLPSNITKMVKHGVNLIQAFGNFDGQYIIALVFMNSISSPDPSQLQDYLRPMSDCAIIEMSSRVSLYCPISRHRIKTPVKGYLCKHSQILNDVAEDVHDVIISEDGSWMVAETDGDTMSHTTETTPAGSLGHTQVNLGTDKQAQNTTVFTPTAGSLGQPQGNTCTTNQGQSATMFTPPAAEIKPEVPPGQTQVDGCTTMQVKSTMMLTPPEGSNQIRVNVCTSNQGQNTTFTPPATVKAEVSPGEAQADICTTTQAKSTTMLTPPEGSPAQIQFDVCKSNQGQSTAFTQPATGETETQVNVCSPMFTPPAFTTPRSFAPASNELRKGGKIGSHTTPGESQPAPNVSQVSPTQILEASGDAMPSGRMRGSLRGEQLQAARLQYLAPPQQPARANEPWSRPPVPSLPLPFIMPKNPTSSDHV
ncbi:hypothetical protein M8C21_016986 [Ambrosia artemisiifolia]|uniref:Uncharacterized protein n=1 Tax=Ambrosia artemisiifolia TaxID=4212 RepID=A0AAD5GTD4_AMBAR|nr:hypothetical protein M8C21_016986 [Ambrosia artemisiifolia]